MNRSSIININFYLLQSVVKKVIKSNEIKRGISQIRNINTGDNYDLTNHIANTIFIHCYKINNREFTQRQEYDYDYVNGCLKGG